MTPATKATEGHDLNITEDEAAALCGGERYAQALFDLANEQNQLPGVESDLKSLKAMIADSRDLRVLLASPAFGSEDKGKALQAVAAAAQLNPTTRKFLGLLAVNGRASALRSVITSFEALAAEADRVLAERHDPVARSSSSIVSRYSSSMPSDEFDVPNCLNQARWEVHRSAAALRSE